jgi:hypothetical protein
MNITIKIENETLQHLKKIVNTTSNAYACKVVLLSHLKQLVQIYAFEPQLPSTEMVSIGLSLGDRLVKLLDEYAKDVVTPMTMPKLVEFIISIELMRTKATWKQYIVKEGGEIWNQTTSTSQLME